MRGLGSRLMIMVASGHLLLLATASSSSCELVDRAVLNRPPCGSTYDRGRWAHATAVNDVPYTYLQSSCYTKNLCVGVLQVVCQKQLYGRLWLSAAGRELSRETRLFSVPGFSSRTYVIDLAPRLLYGSFSFPGARKTNSSQFARCHVYGKSHAGGGDPNGWECPRKFWALCTSDLLFGPLRRMSLRTTARRPLQQNRLEIVGPSDVPCTKKS